ncbi:UDP-galactose transporter senju [Lepeophtheirus salmonis]|uniref:UDP-galactose transporter senju n=1 Tax=Lepeophtheirus salmonis TaxID=72036 RepID=UPI001AE32900|nr:UDP-galactose transporter senju-like [Lepeophtheirus salmonis]
MSSSFLNLEKLFPTKWSGVIFIAYMSLFINQGLLITYSRQGGSTYPYNPTIIILVSEIIKLIISLFIQIASNGPKILTKNITKNRVLLAYYFLPSFQYAIYNNLTFINLSIFDPTTYFILLQIRLILTGVIYQVIFKKYLTRKQWFSLIILTIGCMIQRMDISSSSQISSRINFGEKGWGLHLILFQALCSVFAGVYNEYIIKSKGKDTEISMQNIYMYSDSVICNLIFMLPNLEGTNFGDFITSIQKNNVLIWIIVNNVLVGLVTSLFLKNLNSILKAFASGLEILFTAILSHFLLGIPIKINTYISIVIVLVSIILYANNPLKTTPVHSKREEHVRDEDKTLLEA